MKNIAVIDVSVLVYNWISNLESKGLLEDGLDSNCVQAQHAALTTIAKATKMLSGKQLTFFVGDSKPYWRTVQLRNLEPSIHYKGGRNHAYDREPYEVVFNSTLRRAFDANIFYFLACEADDLALAICHYYRRAAAINLVTIDCDWLQLVNPHTFWCDSSRSNPIWGLDEAQLWLDKKLPGRGNNKNKTQFLEQYRAGEIPVPDAIGEYKSLWGDPSDNLPPGTPIEYISLNPDKPNKHIPPEVVIRSNGYPVDWDKWHRSMQQLNNSVSI